MCNRCFASRCLSKQIYLPVTSATQQVRTLGNRAFRQPACKYYRRPGEAGIATAPRRAVRDRPVYSGKCSQKRKTSVAFTCERSHDEGFHDA
jgi:hypothetical protein